MADPNTDDTYDPSEVEATREREQGLGMGQRDLERQRDPTRIVENRTFQPMAEVEDPDEPASGGIQQGANHTRREDKDKIFGQGPKTLRAQREQQKRST
ncbi:MAG TPA: hypothetical protein VFN88_04150 [Caulobacteraceae bacterium]|nr:hypothetical protein [Caulobacteraceae bacterium]